MVTPMTGFMLKVFILSALLSIAIKYGGPFLPVTETTTTVLIAICSPSILMAILFGWRWQQQQGEKLRAEDSSEPQ